MPSPAWLRYGTADPLRITVISLLLLACCSGRVDKHKKENRSFDTIGNPSTGAFSKRQSNVNHRYYSCCKSVAAPGAHAPTSTTCVRHSVDYTPNFTLFRTVPVISNDRST